MKLMKRFWAVILTCALLLPTLVTNVYAEDTTTTDDGAYLFYDDFDSEEADMTAKGWSSSWSNIFHLTGDGKLESHFYGYMTLEENTAVAAWKNYTIEADVTLTTEEVTGNGSNGRFAAIVIGTGSDVSKNYYEWRIHTSGTKGSDLTGTEDRSVRLYKRENGNTATQCFDATTVNDSVNFGTEVHMKMEVSETGIACYLNNQHINTYSVEGGVSATTIGLRSVGNVCKFDNLRVYSTPSEPWFADTFGSISNWSNMSADDLSNGTARFGDGYQYLDGNILENQESYTVEAKVTITTDQITTTGSGRLASLVVAAPTGSTKGAGYEFMISSTLTDTNKDKVYDAATDQVKSQYCQLKDRTGNGKDSDSIPCTIELGKTYTLKMVVSKTQILCYIDDDLKITYDYAGAETNPFSTGTIGLRAVKNKVEFDNVSVRPGTQDDNNYYDVAFYRGDRETVIHPTKKDAVFAGWYKDAAFTTPLGMDEATGKAYAKFVDADILTVQAQVTAGTDETSNETDIRFVSTVDSLEYEEVGFEITIEGRETEKITDTTVYEELFAVGSSGDIDTLTPDKDFCTASEFFYAYSYWGVPKDYFNTTFKVIPFWKTPDGTTVYGKTAIKSVQESYLGVLGMPDFLVEVESGRDPVVLQLTDTQTIDASQERTADRLGENGDAYWAQDKMEERLYSYIRETVAATNPDLIIITGDIVYGEFDDAGTSLTSFITFMEEEIKIPWAPILGNHEIESTKGVDWQCEQFENAEYCLFEQRQLTGNGNYTIGIKQDNELKRVFFMMDSNGSRGASEESLANGHSVKTDGFGDDQIEWYTETAKRITAASPETKFSFAFHIQLAVFADALEKYGFDNETTEETPININQHSEKADSDFGYMGENMANAWDKSYVVWNSLKSLGVDSIFVGHTHRNCASVVYDGIRLQYGQKTGTYDKANFLESDGTIVGMSLGDKDGTRTPLVGGTVIPLSEEDGSISNPYIYLCKDADGNEVSY